MDMTAVIDALAERAAAAVPVEQGDFYNEDGLLCCHKCGTPKQCRVTVFDTERIVPCICKCEADRKAAEDRERARIDFEKKCRRYRRMGFHDESLHEWTFANDDMSNPQLTKAMQKYVENFAEFRKQGKGLLLYGDVGTGKTYAACEVANALIDKGYPVLVTNFARIVNILQGTFEKQQYIDGLNQFSLLVIDDLAAESDTNNTQSQVWSVIDARYRAGLPMIITTNLSGSALKQPDNLSKKRTYSRLLERCHPIEVKGADRRKAILAREHGDMKSILGM